MSYFQQKRLYAPNFVGNGYRSSPVAGSHAARKKKIVFWSLLSAGFLLLVFLFWFTRNVLVDLSDVTKVKDMVFSQATLIQDRNGETLYSLYDENREYKDYTGISLNMVNAIVAIEDQRYWEHNGLDAMGMLRAGLKALVNPGSKIQGASTIPQQLVRNLLLTKDRKITRKLKEIILTSRLDGVLERQIRVEKPNLSSAELRKEMKIKTLELYLNYISFGNNAFGVETASKTYFAKSANDLTVLEASILASIPKGPSLYNPYKNRGLVVGEFDIKDAYGNKAQVDSGITQQINAKFTQIVTNADFSNKKKDNAVIKYLKGIGSFDITTTAGASLKVQFINGRKDLVLTRMFEDGYISEAQLKEAIIQGLTYQFRTNATSMLAPHFVQWIIELLEAKYDTGVLFKGGFTIKTTLDLKVQKMAEDAIVANNAALQDNGANNSSMLYLDTKNGDVLAYVGSIDYFNTDIQGQNDMVRNPRQPGSSIKPFVYALGLEKLPLTLDTPIFDIPFQIGPDKPNDADDRFEGMLPLRQALGHSRNIPAAKMITALGGETVVKPFLHQLGLSGVSDNIEYGYTLALGAAEIPMMEMANAYSHLSTDTPGIINPILEIRSRDGSLLYERTGENKQAEVIKPGVRYLMWKILSSSADRIIGWETKFNVAGLTFGLKTGTSDAKTPKGNRPRDGWVAAYTPSKVVMLWMGNADATPMNVNAFGGSLATPLKKFLGGLLKNNYITNEAMPEKDTVSVQVSKVSGKLASPTTPADLVVSTLKYAGSPSPAVDEGAIGFQYDASCNGQLSPFTSSENTKQGYIITPSSFMPNGMDIKEITQWWKDSTSMSGQALGVTGKVAYNYRNIFVAQPQNMCDGSAVKEDQTIQVQLSTPTEGATIGTKFSVSYAIQATKNIRKVMVLLDGQAVATFNYPSGDTKSVTDTKQVSLMATGFKNGNYTLQLVAFDFAGFSNKKEVSVKLDKTSTPAPAPAPAPKQGTGN
ncbi:MAG: transglycosylase domain-containing protein [candidate division SR1 bacterium]|nr:transglycosylase domain-containing protein [candidate division SR1 bacterium]